MFKKMLMALLFMSAAVPQPYAWGAQKNDDNEEKKQDEISSGTPNRSKHHHRTDTPVKMSVALENPCKKILNALNSNNSVQVVVQNVNEILVHYMNSIPYSATMGTGMNEQQAFAILCEMMSLPVDEKWKPQLKTLTVSRRISDDDIQFLRKQDFFATLFLMLCSSLSFCSEGKIFSDVEHKLSAIAFAAEGRNYVLQFQVIPEKNRKFFNKENTKSLERRFGLQTSKLLYKFANNNPCTVIDFCLPVQKPYELSVEYYSYENEQADGIKFNLVNIIEAKSPEYDQSKNDFKSLFSFTDDSVENILKKFFNKIPSQWRGHALAKEGFYKNLFFCLAKFMMSDAQVSTEVCEKDGRIDVYIESEAAVQIVEFKFGIEFKTTVDSALKQIIEKKYAEAHRYPGKDVTLVGINIQDDYENKPKITVKSQEIDAEEIKPAKKVNFNFPQTSSVSSLISSSDSNASTTLTPVRPNKQNKRLAKTPPSQINTDKRAPKVQNTTSSPYPIVTNLLQQFDKLAIDNGHTKSQSSSLVDEEKDDDNNSNSDDE